MRDIQPVVQKLKRLSRRELEVLQERCQGKSIADIADTLVIVESTVKHHLGNIYAKLELDHLPQAARNLEIPKFCEALPFVPEEDILQPEPEPQLNAPQPMNLVPVLEDELALVQQEQGAIQLWSPGMSAPNSDRPFTQNRQRGVRNLLILIISTAVISGLAGAGIMALIFTLTTPVVSPQQAQPLTLAVSPQALPTLVPTIPPPSPPPSIPINDNFANAIVINTLPFSDSLNLKLATTEVGEPLLCSFGETEDEYTDRTVWYRFTPTTTVGLYATMRSEFVTNLVIYSGSSLDSLTRSGCVSSAGEMNRGVLPNPFYEGTTYYLQIGSVLGSTVDFKFELYEP